MEMVMTNGFAELSVNEMDEINGGGGLAAAIVGGLITCVVYEIANGICEDITGKTIGKCIADKFFS